MKDSESVPAASPSPPISSSAGLRPQDTLLMQGAMDAPSTPGTLGRLDRFEILSLIGQGGMGQVYLAREPLTDTRVALKILTPQLAGDPQSVHRFLTEARHMYRLSHPRILRVLEVSDRKEGPYYVMPYIAGGDLRGQSQPGQAVPPDRALAIARQVAEALAHAHARGLIHRDLKPANVLLDKDGNAYLTDFGLVRTVFNDSMVDASASHLEGTAPYMSPAMARGDAEDTRCDIYAFGALLYEMLTGQPPYTGRTPQIILDQVLKGPPKPIREVNPKANPALTRIAEGCMARELRDRYASMADVLADLDRAAQNRAPLGPHGQQRRNLPRLAAVAAGVLVVVGLVWAGVQLVPALRAPSRPTSGAGSPEFPESTPETPPAPDLTGAKTEGAFSYTVAGGKATIVKYDGPGGDVTIPSTIDGVPVTTISDWAFRDCANVNSVAVPKTVDRIQTTAFVDCAELQTITVAAGNPVYSSGTDGVLFNKDGMLVHYPSGRAGDYTIPDGVSGIQTWAFAGCAMLTGVTLPSSVTGIGNWVFRNCPRLGSVYFMGEAPTLGAGVFVGTTTNATIYYRPGTKGWGKEFGGRPTKVWEGESGGATAQGSVVPAGAHMATGSWRTVFEDCLQSAESMDRLLGAESAAALVHLREGMRISAANDLAGVWVTNAVAVPYRFAFDVKNVSIWPPHTHWWIAGPGLGHGRGLGYCCVYQDDKLKLLRAGKPVQEIVAHNLFPSGTWVNVTCERTRSQISVMIDGAPALSYTDPEPLEGPLHARVGFGTGDAVPGILFRNVVLSSAAPEPDVPIPFLPEPTRHATANGDLLYRMDPSDAGCRDGWVACLRDDCVSVENGELHVGKDYPNNDAVELLLKQPVRGPFAWEIDLQYPSLKNAGAVFMLWLGSSQPPTSRVQRVAAWIVTAVEGNGVTSLTWSDKPSQPVPDSWIPGWWGIPGQTVAATEYYAIQLRQRTTLRIERDGAQVRLFRDGRLMLEGTCPNPELAGLDPVHLGFGMAARRLTIHAMRVYALPSAPAEIPGAEPVARAATPSLWDGPFGYTVADGKATIVKYNGPGGALAIPRAIDGVPVTCIGASAFKNCWTITSVTIPNSVTNVEASAFARCGALASVAIPDSVISIGGTAFAYCTGLTSVHIPSSVTAIGDAALSGCRNMATVTLSTNVSTIGRSLLAGCEALTDITIPASLTRIEEQMFVGCFRLTNVAIGCRVTDIGVLAFGGCTALTDVTFPSGIASIGREAFARCRALTSLRFHGNAPILVGGQGTFSDAEKVTIYYRPGTKGWGPEFGGRPTKVWEGE